MIAMMIVMILTNKEWCRFIANNVGTGTSYIKITCVFSSLG
jgi:hypothetical protein